MESEAFTKEFDTYFRSSLVLTKTASLFYFYKVIVKCSIGIILTGSRQTSVLLKSRRPRCWKSEYTRQVSCIQDFPDSRHSVMFYETDVVAIDRQCPFILDSCIRNNGRHITSTISISLNTHKKTLFIN